MNYLRLKKNTDFQKVFNRGKRVFSPYITLLYFKSDKLVFGVVVSKKHGKAHTRNRIKRLLRAAFSEECKKLSDNFLVVAIPKVSENYTFEGFKCSFEICIKKVNAQCHAE